MIDWTARARAVFAKAPAAPTAKGDETPLSSVSSVADGPVCGIVRRMDSANPDRWCWPHSDAMNSAEIATFTRRVEQSIRGGMTEAQAEALADDMVQRDRHPDDWREAFEERAAIMEFDGGLSRDDAEAEARACVTCEFQSRRKTCLEPVLAGLAPHFSIRFTEQAPDAGAACVAYRGKS